MQSTTDNSHDTSAMEKSANKQVPLCGSYRLFVTVISSFTLCTSLASQTSMNSAMVCMLEPRNDHRTLDSNVTATDINSWKYDWDSTTKGWVIASFFIGYCVVQIPAGILVNKFGAKAIVVIGLLATAIFQVFTVPAVRWSMPLLYIARFLAGVACGFLYPSMFHLVANWAPRQETTRLFSIAGVGIESGNSLSFFMSMFACEIDFQGGWPIVFYTIGLIQIVLAIIIIFGVTNYPSNNRYVSQKEVKYIADSSVIDKDDAQNRRIPVGAILRSVPVWGGVVSQFGSEWMYYTLYTQLPLFMRDFLNLSAWKTNIICSVPLLAAVPTVFVTSYASDKLIEKGMLSVTRVRQFNDIYAKILMATPLVIMGYLPQGAWVTVFMLYLVVAIGFTGICSGYLTNPGDLSPAHTAFLTGLGQGLTLWVSFVIPVLNASITSEETRESWQLVFYICLIVGLVTTFCFFLMASGELQPWATEINENIPIMQLPNGRSESKQEITSYKGCL